MGESKITIHSRRFGEITVPADAVFKFAEGLVGLPACQRFVILDHQPSSPFKWMVCLDNPELGLAVVNPEEFVPGYKVCLDGAARELDIGQVDEVAVFTIVTIPRDPKQMTVDLLAPVVVNLRTRAAKQIVMNDSSYSAAHPLVSAS